MIHCDLAGFLIAGVLMFLIRIMVCIIFLRSPVNVLKIKCLLSVFSTTVNNDFAKCTKQSIVIKLP